MSGSGSFNYVGTPQKTFESTS